ncbi:DNA polymerase V [Anaeroplasma bactoclasticum]|uniref:DNA polymerase V n=2 Tax=Anaeroplasma bactoclasticum TaxID=2088 RepID=A0A397RRX2_9MOLU|nr:DNA polymerase V [Anaeroplasma bactoclasticum]
MEDKTYLCIDLKTFYASVECVERGLDPFTTKLVVADPDRKSTTICLAISPRMKELGIHNRCRLFEIPKDISYIMAKPRMKTYIAYSANIYAIYLKYVSKEDIYVYSIDECFMDVTSYLEMYQMSASDLAKKIIDDIYNTTGITATAGIGTNLFLTKVAMDIDAKHREDHLGYLDIEEFKKRIWHHKPITDIWQIGHGTAKRLEKYGVYDLYGITTLNKDILYKEFGVNAEILIDHANGIEPTTIEEIKSYVPESNSISTQQILAEGYKFDKARLAFSELVEMSILDLVDRGVVVSGISIGVSYREKRDVKWADMDNPYKSLRGDYSSFKLDEYVNSYKILYPYFMDMFDKNVKKDQIIRSISLGFFGIKDESYKTYDLFMDEDDLKKEEALSHTIIDLKKKYGKNSILKAQDLEDYAIAKERNKTIGGHNSEWF